MFFLKCIILLNLRQFILCYLQFQWENETLTTIKDSQLKNLTCVSRWFDSHRLKKWSPFWFLTSFGYLPMQFSSRLIWTLAFIHIFLWKICPLGQNMSFCASFYRVFERFQGLILTFPSQRRNVLMTRVFLHHK